MTNFVGYRDGGKTNEEGLMKFLSRGYTSGMPLGFNATALQVSQRGAGANMSVDIATGDAHFILPSTQYSYWGWTDAVNNQTITSADPSNPRIDVIYAYVDLSVVSSASNNNPGALKFGVSTGTAAASPAANADSVIQTALGATTPFVKLATVLVGAAASSITNAVITDIRASIGSNMPSATSTGADGWTASGETWTYAGNNGQKEFTVTIAGDKTGKYPIGAKVKIPRSVAPPTQCMAFVAASSQYATKATPSGITFTGPFTCESWIYTNSYTGTETFIINRRNVTFAGGWGLSLSFNGQLVMIYGTGANATNFLTAQSVPLKRWIHVAAAVTSVVSKTALMYINGVSVPFSSSVSAATSLTQTADDLRIGAIGGGLTTGTYFDGYISETRVWSVAQSQASIQANMTVSLTGSESNLVALFQGNGNFNDKTANANNLTPNGGAIATQAANPYNATEYGIITATSYSAPNTTLTIFCGTDYTIPNQTLGSPSWSMQRTPFGFPASKNKWAVDTLIRVNTVQSSPTVSTWYNTGSFQLLFPTGEWSVYYFSPLEFQKASSGVDVKTTLSTGAATESDTLWTVWFLLSLAGVTSQDNVGSNSKQGYLSVTSALTYYINQLSTTASMVSFTLRGLETTAILRAESAYV